MFRQNATRIAETLVTGLANRSMRIRLSATAMLLAVFNLPAHADEVTRLDVTGGLGGTYFEQACAPGSVLVGVRSYAGDWLDNVQAVCARMTASGPVDAQAHGPVFGGASGRTTQGYTCPSGTVAAGFGVLEKAGDHLLALIGLHCRDAFTLRPVSLGLTGQVQGRGNVKSIGSPIAKCPETMVAIGIRGRAATYLDAFGLLCGPMPQEKTTSHAAPVRVLGKRSSACKAGFVWREASAGDRVCVPPEARSRTAEENRVAGQRRDPSGAYGPNTCKQGFVWREAFAGDVVCVTPEVRSLVREENRLDSGRRGTN